VIRTIVCTLGVLLAATGTARAQITAFDLMGNGGTGLLGSNEAPTPVVGGGSGGEIGAGITFNAATNVLTVNVGWGSGNGFTNLTGNATIAHIHGPTDLPFPAGQGWNQAVGIRYNLHTEPGWNPSSTNGAFNGVVNILQADVAGLFEGRFYINIHTSVNPAGEIRGQLMVVPEPTSMALVGVGAVGLAWRRFRRPTR
jgi:hypothetical protein